MQKILFIIQSYPSEKSANVLCDEKIMNLFAEREEYEVHCLCFQYFGQAEYQKIGNINVHRWNRGLWWNIFTKAEFREMKNGKLIIGVNRFIMRLKQILCIPIFPFYEPLVAKKYAKEVQKLYRKEHFDLVISEHNGLETTFAGWKLKRMYRDIKYVPIFWDAMSGGFRPKYLPKQYVDKRKQNLEAKILKDCDKAIMMMAHKKHILNMYADQKKLLEKVIFLDIPYLVEQEKVDKKELWNDRKVHLMFAGNMGMRDPEYLFLLVKVSKLENLVFHFYTDVAYHKKIKHIAQKYGINIELNNYVPHNELIKYLATADILINYGVDNPNAISGKIFEYMGFLKPIISTYFRDDEATIPFLKKYPNSFLVDERKDVKLQVENFRKFILSIGQSQIDFNTVKELFKYNLPETYFIEIRKVMETKGEENE